MSSSDIHLEHTCYQSSIVSALPNMVLLKCRASAKYKVN